jgi:hypothetical protein
MQISCMFKKTKKGDHENAERAQRYGASCKGSVCIEAETLHVHLQMHAFIHVLMYINFSCSQKSNSIHTIFAFVVSTIRVQILSQHSKQS